MKLAVRHLCPECGTDPFNQTWSAADWADYRRRIRTPICCGCARLLAVGPDDLELRLPTELETFRAYAEIDAIEAIQLAVLHRLRIGSRRIV